MARVLLSRVLVRGGGATEGRNGEWGEHYRGKSCDKKNNGQLARCWCHKHVWPRLSSVSFLFGGCHQHLLKLHSSPQKLHTCPSPSLLPTETSLADSTFGYIDTKSEGKDSEQKFASHVQSSTIHTSPKVKTILTSMDGWMDR